MKQVLTLTIMLSLLACSSFAIEQADTLTTDTSAVALDQTIRVVGYRLTNTKAPFPFAKDQFNQVLAENGFGLVSKGVFLAQDVYADGFKRDDFTVVIDGERYHSACPNRMDSPLARSNSLEMNSIDLNKTSSAIYSGLSGSVGYHRTPITNDDLLRGGFAQSLGASQSSDVGFSGMTHQHRVAGRYATGTGYEDGDGQDFVDRYSYREDYTYTLAEISATGKRGDIVYHGEYTYTEDIMFPYLLMDERFNRVFSGSVDYRGNKLYMTYTDHVMDNSLRVSNMHMVTDATNLTVGLVGDFYELYYRRWNAENLIRTPMTTITNDLMPGVNQYSANVFYKKQVGNTALWARLGLSRFAIDDLHEESFYKLANGTHGSDNLFGTWALGVASRRSFGESVSGSLALDLVSEPPFAQATYISVVRPMGKPWWAGNPGLDAPLRAGVRGSLSGYGVTLESSASYVWHYVNLTGRESLGITFRTYENVDALLLSMNVKADWRYLTVASGYTWANRYPDDQPLVEVAPFYLSTTVKSPSYKHATAYVRHVYNDAQTRVDPDLSETATGSWHRLDLGVRFVRDSWLVSLEVENLLDELYTQHMSYLRNPYSSGERVYEPGRTIRLNVTMSVGDK